MTGKLKSSLLVRTTPGFAKSTSLLVSLLSLAVCASAHAQNDVRIAWRGFGQFTGEWNDADDGIESDVERLRARVQVSADRFAGVVQFDFAASNLSDNPPGTLANVIQDVFFDYNIAKAGRLRVGQFKTPLGYDFNISSHQLDITKRGMEYGLTLNRAMGAMYSDSLGSGPFSFDVGLFNTPGRSASTRYDDDQVGQDNAVVGRLRFDDGPWHAEAAIAQADAAGGPDTPDYSVYDFAVHYSADRWTAKFEWIDGDDVRGQSERSEQVWYLHGSYRLSPKLELVGRHYIGRSDIGADRTDLTNTYLGVTLRPADVGRFQTRLQVNYVAAGGDELAYTGVRGYRDDALFAQFLFLIQGE